jgi:hypothetical protein
MVTGNAGFFSKKRYAQKKSDMNALVPRNLNQKSFKKIARQSTTVRRGESVGMLVERSLKIF